MGFGIPKSSEVFLFFKNYSGLSELLAGNAKVDFGKRRKHFFAGSKI